MQGRAADGSVLIWILILFFVFAGEFSRIEGSVLKRVHIAKTSLVLAPNKIPVFNPSMPCREDFPSLNVVAHLQGDNCPRVNESNLPLISAKYNVRRVHLTILRHGELDPFNVFELFDTEVVEPFTNLEHLGYSLTHVLRNKLEISLVPIPGSQIGIMVEYKNSRPLGIDSRPISKPHRLRSASSFHRLPAYKRASYAGDNDQPPIGDSPPMGPLDGCVPGWRVATGFGLICLALGLFVFAVQRDNGWLALFCIVPFVIGSLIWLTGHYPCTAQKQSDYHQVFPHDGANVSHGSVQIGLRLATVLGYGAHSTEADRPSLVGVDLFSKGLIGQFYAETYRSLGVAHRISFFVGKSSSERKLKLSRLARMDVESEVRTSIFGSIRKLIGGCPPHELNPCVGNNSISGQSSAIEYFHIHDYPVAVLHCFVEDIVHDCADFEPRAKRLFLKNELRPRSFRLLGYNDEGYDECPDRDAVRPSEIKESEIPPSFAVLCGIGGILFCLWSVIRRDRQTLLSAIACGVIGMCLVVQGYQYGKQEKDRERAKVFLHNGENCITKTLDSRIIL